MFSPHVLHPTFYIMPSLPRVSRFVSNTNVRIYRIPCQALPGLSVRVYLLLGAGVPTLVDAGSGHGECTAQILAGFEQIRDEFGDSVRPADVRRIIITHAHLDHFGGLAELRQEMPAHVAIHPLDSGEMTSWEEHAVISKRRLDAFLEEAGVAAEERAALVATARFERERIQAVPVDFWLEDGHEIDGLKVIHTPGHSAGHCCLGVGNILLSADHILARTVPQQWPERMAPYLGLPHYLDSLEKIARTPGFELTLAAHEEVIRDVYHRIDVIRESHQRRCNRLLSFLDEAESPLSIAELSRKMYGVADGFRGVLALTDVGARVEYLHQLGRVALANLDEVEANDRAVWRFRCRM